MVEIRIKRNTLPLRQFRRQIKFDNRYQNCAKNNICVKIIKTHLLKILVRYQLAFEIYNRKKRLQKLIKI